MKFEQQTEAGRQPLVELDLVHLYEPQLTVDGGKVGKRRIVDHVGGEQAQ